VNVVITEWALQSYVDLKGSNVFTDQDYWQTLRPDVERLAVYPNDLKFQQPRFWGPATDKTGNVLPDGYKMKWRNLGPGQVQLRLAVAIIGGEALLCQAYVKDNDAKDKREMAKFLSHLKNIRAGNYVRRGHL
jgi:hypothetical protein